MPPVNPQGSRGGLITAVVIFTILFVTATIFAIYFGVDDQKQKDAVRQDADRSKTYYGDINTPTIKQLILDANNKYPNLKDRSALGVAVYRIEELQRQILGSQVPATNSTEATKAAADAALAKVNTDLQNAKLTTVPTTSLVDAITALGDGLIKAHETALTEHTDEQSVVTSAQAKLDANQKELDAAKSESEQAKKDAAAAAQQVADIQAAKITEINNYNKQLDAERDQWNVKLAKIEKDNQDLNKKIGLLDRERTQLIQKIAKTRLNPQDLMVRRSQGQILSVASEDIVYIDLGQGEQIVPGMTFEVYNKHDGIPAMTDGMSDDVLPPGEASLEVQQVLATSSQCRVTKLQPGQHITEGDIIANLVYDRNTKFNFVVYGKFHLNPNTPDATSADADIIKGLIVKWGGKIQDHVDVDTDFVVMGEEPKVKDLSADDTDAFDKAQHDKEVAEQQAYSDVLDKAKDYSKTFMNQNQFLYYTGYYPLASR